MGNICAYCYTNFRAKCARKNADQKLSLVEPKAKAGQETSVHQSLQVSKAKVIEIKSLEWQQFVDDNDFHDYKRSS